MECPLATDKSVQAYLWLVGIKLVSIKQWEVKMLKLFNSFLDRLGSPKDQKSESVALTVIYCMYLSFAMMLLILVMPL